MTDANLARIFDELADAVQVDHEALAKHVSGLDRATGRPGPRSWPQLFLVGGVATAGVVASAVAVLGLMLGDAPSGPSQGPATSDSIGPLLGAAERNQYIDELTQLADRDDRFVGWRSADSGTQVILYGAAERAPSAITEVMDRAPSDLQVIWEQVPYTESQLEQTLKVATSAIPGVTLASYSQMMTHVTVGIWPANSDQLRAAQELADRLDTPAPITVYAEPPSQG